MDCGSFHDRLDGFLDGSLAGDELRAAREHLDCCPACRDLATLAGMAVVEPPADLVGSVLERTTGSACGSARERLPGLVDGTGDDAVASELVRMHLEGCADCASLSRVMARLSEDLPALAELRPDERFVSDVLGRTVSRRKRWARWAARVSEAWPRVLQRPRFALEAAYVGTLILALVFWIPDSPLAGASRQALELARRNPVSELRRPSADAIETVTARVSGAWGDTGREIEEVSRAVADDLAQRSRHSSTSSDEIRAHGADLRDAVAGADAAAAFGALKGLAAGLGSAAASFLWYDDDSRDSDDDDNPRPDGGSPRG